MKQIILFLLLTFSCYSQNYTFEEKWVKLDGPKYNVEKYYGEVRVEPNYIAIDGEYYQIISSQRLIRQDFLIYSCEDVKTGQKVKILFTDSDESGKYVTLLFSYEGYYSKYCLTKVES